MQHILYFAFVLILCAEPAMAADHANHVSGFFPDARAVTAECLGCHREQGEDFLKTAHWNWKGLSPFVSGHERETGLGKRNLINNF